LREFGFPRANELKKIFKWKKMNFTTDLPKQDPICSYLVATGKVDDECYRMHVVVNSKEYSKEYRKSEVLKELKSGQHKFEMNNPNFDHKEKERQKLLPQDRIQNTDRIILCHVIRINSGPSKFEDIAEPLVRSSRPKTFKAPPKTRKKRRTRADKLCESDSDESSIHLTSDEDDDLEDPDDFTKVYPIAMSRPKRACIFK
jgi:hypothetical protein